MEKIYLVKFESFNTPYYFWCLCTNIIQYCFDEGNELYTYKNYIALKDKKPTWVEANFLYSTVKFESGLCSGKAVEIIELVKGEDDLAQLFAEREMIESKIDAIDPGALIAYEFERLNKPSA